MSDATLAQKDRAAFQAMFDDLALAKAEGRKEDAARIAFALMEPMVPAQEALNAYKRRIAFALESGNTAFGLAAVRAFRNAMIECATRDGQAGRIAWSGNKDLLTRAADLASRNALSNEISASSGHFEATRLKRGLDAWLDENLEELDRLIGEEASPGAKPSMG